MKEPTSMATQGTSQEMIVCASESPNSMKGENGGFGARTWKVTLTLANWVTGDESSHLHESQVPHPKIWCGKLPSAEWCEIFNHDRDRLFTTSWTGACQAPLSVEFFSKNTGMGCHFLLQGIFPTQGWKLCLLHLLHRQTRVCKLEQVPFWGLALTVPQELEEEGAISLTCTFEKAGSQDLETFLHHKTD